MPFAVQNRSHDPGQGAGQVRGSHVLPTKQPPWGTDLPGFRSLELSGQRLVAMAPTVYHSPSMLQRAADRVPEDMEQVANSPALATPPNVPDLTPSLCLSLLEFKGVLRPARGAPAYRQICSGSTESWTMMSISGSTGLWLVRGTKGRPCHRPCCSRTTLGSHRCRRRTWAKPPTHTPPKMCAAYFGKSS